MKLNYLIFFYFLKLIAKIYQDTRVSYSSLHLKVIQIYMQMVFFQYYFFQIFHCHVIILIDWLGVFTVSAVMLHNGQIITKWNSSYMLALRNSYTFSHLYTFSFCLLSIARFKLQCKSLIVQNIPFFKPPITMNLKCVK